MSERMEFAKHEHHDESGYPLCYVCKTRLRVTYAGISRMKVYALEVADKDGKLHRVHKKCKDKL